MADPDQLSAEIGESNALEVSIEVLLKIPYLFINAFKCYYPFPFPNV